MPLISTSLTLLVTGLLLGFVNVSIPMSQRSHRILNVGVFVSVILWLLSSFGIVNLQRIFTYLPVRLTCII